MQELSGPQNMTKRLNRSTRRYWTIILPRLHSLSGISQHLVNSFPFLFSVSKLFSVPASSMESTRSSNLCRYPCLQGTASCKMKRTIGRISGKSSKLVDVVRFFSWKLFNCKEKVSLPVDQWFIKFPTKYHQNRGRSRATCPFCEDKLLQMSGNIRDQVSGELWPQDFQDCRTIGNGEGREGAATAFFTTALITSQHLFGIQILEAKNERRTTCFNRGETWVFYSNSPRKGLKVAVSPAMLADLLCFLKLFPIATAFSRSASSFWSLRLETMQPLGFFFQSIASQSWA